MSVADAVQAELDSSGQLGHAMVTRWLVIAEVQTADQNAVVHVDGDSMSNERLPTWQKLGLLAQLTKSLGRDLRGH